MGRAPTETNVFTAIACPTRRALLDALVRGESNVSDLVAALDVTQSAVSQQLTILKSAGLVEERAEGRYRYYSLRIEPLTEVDDWLDRYRAYINRQLDALGEVLDAMPDKGDPSAVAPADEKPSPAKHDPSKRRKK